MKKHFLIPLILLSYNLIVPHEFWLHPDKFFYKRGEKINIRLREGRNFEVKNWTDNKELLQTLHIYFGGVKDKDLLKSFPDKKGDSIQLTLLDEGTIMICSNSINTITEMQADNFNNYLLENGFTEAIQYRQQNNDTNTSGREYFHSSMKTIFQVGTKTDKTYKQKTDLLIDIIPEDHPYNAANEEKFKIKVLFKGEPLAHQKVKVSHRLNNTISQIEYTTDEDGNFKFFFTPAGHWMVSIVKMIRLKNDPSAEWQSYWSSLTWGYIN
jgi:uncharacterized protein DUF4198